MSPRGSDVATDSAVATAAPDVATAAPDSADEEPAKVATAAPGSAGDEPAKVDGPQTPDTKRSRLRVAKHKRTAAAPTSTPMKVELLASIPNTTTKREYKLGKLGAASKYQGVSWHGLTGKWQACFKTVYIGLYETEEDAAEARWQYEQTAQPEVEVASTSITQLLSGVRPEKPEKPEKPATGADSLAEEAAARPAEDAAARPARRRAAEARAPKSAAASDAKKPMSQFFTSCPKAPSAQQPTPKKRGPELGKTFRSWFGGGAAKTASAVASAQQPPTASPQQATAKKSRSRLAAPQPGIAKEAVVDEQQLAETYAKLAKLDAATPEEEALMPRWLRTFQTWMQSSEKGLKEITAKSKIQTLRLMFEVDRKSPSSMATSEYLQLAKEHREGIVGIHSVRCSTLSLWADFFQNHKDKGSILEEANDAAAYRVRTVEEFQTRRKSSSGAKLAAEDGEPANKRQRGGGGTAREEASAGQATQATLGFAPAAKAAGSASAAVSAYATMLAAAPAPTAEAAPSKAPAAKHRRRRRLPAAGSATPPAAALATTAEAMTAAALATTAEAASSMAPAKPAAAAEGSCGGEAVVDEKQLAETYAKLAKLDAATPEEEALMPRWLRTFQTWMLAKGLKENTVYSKIGTFRLMFEVDRKSPSAMTTPEYLQLAKEHREGINGVHSLRESSLKGWAEFFQNHKDQGSALEEANDAAAFRVRTVEEFNNRKKPANGAKPGGQDGEPTRKRQRPGQPGYARSSQVSGAARAEVSASQATLGFAPAAKAAASATMPAAAPATAAEVADFAELGDGVLCFWKVIARHCVNVRGSMDLGAEPIGLKQPGDQLQGKQAGDWLELVGEPGFIVIKGKVSGTRFLQCCGKVDKAEEAAELLTSSSTAAPAEESAPDAVAHDAVAEEGNSGDARAEKTDVPSSQAGPDTTTEKTGEPSVPADNAAVVDVGEAEEGNSGDATTEKTDAPSSQAGPDTATEKTGEPSVPADNAAAVAGEDADCANPLDVCTTNDGPDRDSAMAVDGEAEEGKAEQPASEPSPPAAEQCAEPEELPEVPGDDNLAF